MANPHVGFLVDNVRVFFPFEPYPTQREYVECVVRALSNKHHALLESPTGTGKTLSLLCSSLAWLQSQGGGKSVIYYTSRTHMQLSQAAKEMKRTAYAKNPAVVIGSRSQMCLNLEVKQAGDHLINRACRNAIAKSACSYYTNYEEKLKVLDMNSVHDIEDLGQFGRTHQCCPYYASKKIAETKASVVFMPYNYLLDAALRKSTQLKLANSVIIFDEAHNIEGVLKDSVSGNFTLTCLNTIQESCLKLPPKIHEALNREKGLSRAGYDPNDKRNGVVDEFAKPSGKKNEKEPKVNPIEELAEKLTNEKLQQVNRCAELLKKETRANMQVDKTSDIDKVFHIMERSGIHYTTSDLLITTLDSMASFWSIAGVMNPVPVARYVSAISNLSNVISLLFPPESLSLIRQTAHKKRMDEFYTSYLRGIYETSSVLSKESELNLKDWELNLWCLHPAIGLKQIIDSSGIGCPRSLIFTSGTLAPMRPIEKELETEFKIIREFKHVISEEQMKIMIIGESPNRYSLESHFEATKKESYAMELGKTLLPLFKVLPFGTLVFFQSYPLMNRVLRFWKEKSNCWRDMTAVSPIFVESKTQASFLSDIVSFKRRIDSTATNARAVFLGVSRGKLSEGINLEGNHCRSVILTGLPFPSLTDPRVQATRRFHERKGDSGGQMWYSQQMTRALNQTVGRVIRSKSDFGMLLLCDPRFNRYRYSLSEWTQKFFPKGPSSWEVVDKDVKAFFQNHGICITESATESVGAFEIGLAGKQSLSDIFNLSPFSEDSKNSSQASKRGSQASKGSSQASSHGSNKSFNSEPEVLSAQERQAAMVAAYRVDRATYDRVKSNQRLRAIEENEASLPKRIRTTSEFFNSICPSSQDNTGLPFEDTNQDSQRDQAACNVPNARPHSPLPAPSTNGCSGTAPPNGTDRTPNQLATQQQSRPDDLSQNSVPKAPPKSLNIFKKKAKRPTTRQTQSTELTASSRGSIATQDYSILNQFQDKNRPAPYKCCICLGAAKEPLRTNCPCARVGCRECVRVLNKKECGHCKVPLQVKQFKPVLFKSAFFARERQPMINAPEGRQE